METLFSPAALTRMEVSTRDIARLFKQGPCKPQHRKPNPQQIPLPQNPRNIPRKPHIHGSHQRKKHHLHHPQPRSSQRATPARKLPRSKLNRLRYTPQQPKRNSNPVRPHTRKLWTRRPRWLTQNCLHRSSHCNAERAESPRILQAGNAA